MVIIIELVVSVNLIALLGYESMPEKNYYLGTFITFQLEKFGKFIALIKKYEKKRYRGREG